MSDKTNIEVASKAREIGWSRVKTTRLLVTLFVIGTIGLALLSGPISLPSHTGMAIAETTQASSARGTVDSQPVGFVAVAAMVTKAVVNIAPSQATPSAYESDAMEQARRFFGVPESPHQRGTPRQYRTGSGVVISADGHILTNYHVVEGSGEVIVTFPDRSKSRGTVLGTDPKTDLAVISVDRKNLSFLTLGSSANLKVGEPVLAVGTPFGLTSTVTQGIVSGLGRSGMGITHYEDFIQTDAAINPGNSGGALVNTRGELIGINTAILSQTGGNLGVGFAIPADMAKRVYEDLIVSGMVHRGYLGVGIQPVTPDLATAFKLEHPHGALITSVEKGSPAQEAGLIRGDIITNFEGKDVNHPQELQRIVTQASVGAMVSFTVIRDGKKIELKTRLDEHPDTSQVADVRSDDFNNVLAAVTVDQLDASMARRLGLGKETSGVVVTALTHGNDAERTGLARGDVITEVNGTPITSVAEYEREVAGLSADQNVLLYIWRSRVPMFMTITT